MDEVRITDEAHCLLRSYFWPGNVGELTRVIECAAEICCPDSIHGDAIWWCLFPDLDAVYL